MERVDQERPGWDGDQFEVLTEEEVVGVNRQVGEEVLEEVVGTEGGPSEGGDGVPRQGRGMGRERGWEKTVPRPRGTGKMRPKKKTRPVP